MRAFVKVSFVTVIDQVSELVAHSAVKILAWRFVGMRILDALWIHLFWQIQGAHRRKRLEFRGAAGSR